MYVQCGAGNATIQHVLIRLMKPTVLQTHRGLGSFCVLPVCLERSDAPQVKYVYSCSGLLLKWARVYCIV